MGILCVQLLEFSIDRFEISQALLSLSVDVHTCSFGIIINLIFITFLAHLNYS